MKHLFGIIVMLTIPFSICMAQNRKSVTSSIFPTHMDSYFQWIGFYKVWNGFYKMKNGNQAIVNIYDRGDSIVNGVTYIKVEMDNMNNLQLLEREVDSKVFRYDDEIRQDVLILDFSLEEGDVVTVDGGMRWKVVETGHFPEYDQYALKENKMLRLRGVDDETLEDIWIEGVGSVYTGVIPRHLMEWGDDIYIANVNLTDDKFATFDVNTEHFKTVNMEYFDLTEEEWNELRKDENKEWQFLEYEFLDDTLYVTGILDINCYNYQMACTITDNGRIDLYVYTLTLFDEADCQGPRIVSSKFPCFKEGSYYLSYNGSTPVQVICGDAMSIHGISTAATDVQQVLYDLNGRPFGTKPIEGIYIKNGRKVMKRK